MDAVQFQTEVLRLERLMYHVSYSMLQSNEDCADAVQEALLCAWHKQSSLHDETKFKAWLMRILVNQCNDVLRRRGRVRFTPIEDSDLSTPPPGPLPPLMEAVQGLKPEQRVAVTLHYQEGYTVEDIATLLRIPTGTVKTRLKAARQRLGDTLRSDWKEGLL